MAIGINKSSVIANESKKMEEKNPKGNLENGWKKRPNINEQKNK